MIAKQSHVDSRFIHLNHCALDAHTCMYALSSDLQSLGAPLFLLITYFAQEDTQERGGQTQSTAIPGKPSFPHSEGSE
jgi:hypothetical protein